jgi:tetratricopeptide (TPR) repeat protein
MKTRDTVIAIVVTNTISILIAVFIVSAMRTEQPQAAKEPAPVRVTAPAAVAPDVSDKPAVNKDAVFELLDSGVKERRKEALMEFKKVMQSVPPYTPLGTTATGYQTALDGDIKKALEITQEEIQRDARRVDSHYTLAWIYAKVGDYDKALKVCREAFLLGPEFYKLHFIEGWVYARQGKYEDAQKACDAALANEPYSASLYYAKGRIADLAGRKEEAVEFYSKAIGIQKDLYTPYIFLGFSYMELGRNDEAIKTFKQAIGLDKYRAGGYAGLGLVYDNQGNYQAALTQYNNAITLGWVSMGSDTPTKSLTMTIEIDDAVIYNRIGMLNIYVEDYNAALHAFTRAIEVRQEYHDSYRGLILTYALMGDKESAMKSYIELKRFNPELAKTVAPFVGQNP